MSEHDAGLIYGKIADILAEVGAVGKAGFNKAQGYKFRGIDDVCNALHGLLATHRVFFKPTVEQSDVTERVSNKGAKYLDAVMTIRFDFCAEDGSSISVTTVGQAADSGDKACNKAMSGALKYALVQLFCIPTQDEADNGSPQVGDDENGPKAKADAFLKDKQDTVGTPDPVAEAKQKFIEAMQKLADRDLKGFALTRADCGRLCEQGKEHSGKTDLAEVAQWIETNAELGAAENPDTGELLAVDLKVKTEAA